MHWQKGKNMKISNYMDNANLIMKTNANKIQKENSQTMDIQNQTRNDE